MLYFSKFFFRKFGECIIHENYTINFFSSRMPHHVQDRMIENKFYL